MFTAGYSLVARVCVLWRGGAGEQPWSSRGGPGGQGVSVSVGHLGFSTACSIHRSGVLYGNSVVTQLAFAHHSDTTHYFRHLTI